MPSLPQDWPALCLLIFTLGLRHGLDADHLATIDGLARVNLAGNPRLARSCGVLFSLGHGAVVLLIALTVGTLARHWQAPHWLEPVGTWISIAFLVGLGVVNLRAVLRTPPGEVVRAVAVKGRLLGGMARAASPGLVALVGALFALSFDTVSQAALFAVAAAQFGGWQYVLALGVLFVLGMLLTDGLNGLWISRLLRRSDRRARVASRVMSLAVASVSLLVAAFALARLAVPDAERWGEGNNLLFGATLIAIVAASFAAALWVTRARRPLAEVDTTAGYRLGNVEPAEPA